MAAEQLLLKGRYLNTVIKYGIATGAACTVSGIATYLIVRKRISASEGYLDSINADGMKAIDDRVMKFAGYNRNEKFPHVPFLDDSENLFDEFYAKHKIVDQWLIVEKELLTPVDPSLKDYFPQLVLTGIRKDWIEDPNQKIVFQKRLLCGRVILYSTLIKELKASGIKLGTKSGKVDKNAFEKLPKHVQLLLLYFTELKNQEQNLPVPLAVKYLPQKPNQ